MASEAPEIPAKPTPPATENEIPLPPETHVVQLSTDQVYGVPPPEKANGRKRRRNPCCCCLRYFSAFVGGYIVLLGLAALIFYLIVRPESPDYSFDSISIRGLNNLTSTLPEEIIPEIEVTFRVGNPNDMVRIDYMRYMSLSISFSNANFGFVNDLPAFYQTSNNVTVFNITLKGQPLWQEGRKALVDAQKQGPVPFRMEMRSSAKFKLGSYTTWRMRPCLFCDVTVDKLTAKSKFVKRKCNYKLDLF